ncbi:hypothetical protein [Sodalis-like endosymbiont of Proechinophthirus fluctus]|uniref:hypothetical protein n=1 Tax=Sodalis-like endosymbiont of Proechinophthirus fluctus TaxID=1462730 RepID=UPI00164FE0E2|nr:hypothetical protein [Sodalis-like endosymbiont of Proechinophthirus fluctus]
MEYHLAEVCTMKVCRLLDDAFAEIREQLMTPERHIQSKIESMADAPGSAVKNARRA